MIDQDQGYYALALGFIALFNLIAVITVFMSYLSSRRSYLQVACFAGLLEILRLGVDLLFLRTDLSITLYMLGLVFQFGSTLLLVAALLLIYERVTKRYYWLFGLLGCGLLASLIAVVVLPQSTEVSQAYLYSAPLISLTLILLWRSWRAGPGITASKVLLMFSSCIMLVVRIAIPGLPINDFFEMLYYMEYLGFLVILIALTSFELEFANRQINTLLDQQTRSAQDLQFIVDNSLDVILVTDHVGLLQSWSSKAQEIFGYGADQVIGKMHMDDLFSSNYWGRDIGQEERFKTQMENVDGRKFPVEVRMRQVSESGSNYHVFVVNVLESFTADAVEIALASD